MLIAFVTLLMRQSALQRSLIYTHRAFCTAGKLLKISEFRVSKWLILTNRALLTQFNTYSASPNPLERLNVSNGIKIVVIGGSIKPDHLPSYAAPIGTFGIAIALGTSSYPIGSGRGFHRIPTDLIFRQTQLT
jgi:hypothetical protein